MATEVVTATNRKHLFSFFFKFKIIAYFEQLSPSPKPHSLLVETSQGSRTPCEIKGS